MAKGDDSTNRQVASATNRKAVQRADNLRQNFMSQYQEAREADKNLRNQLEQGFLGIQNKYSIDGGTAGDTSGGAGGAGVSIPGGIDPNKINNLAANSYNIYETLGKGLSPEFMNEWKGYASGLGTAGKTLDEAEDSYRNFILSGGYKQPEIDAMRAAAMAPTTAIYKNAQDEAQRQANLTGRAFSPAALSRLTREQAASVGDVATATEANLAQLKQQGRQFGTAGLESAAGTRANIAAVGMEARRAVEALDAQMRAQGAAGMSEIEKERMAFEFQNAALNQAAARSRAAAAEAAASRSAADARFRAGLEQFGLEGALRLYGTTPAATELGQRGLLAEQELYQNDPNNRPKEDDGGGFGWRDALAIGGTAAMAFSDRNMKEKIKVAPSKVLDKINDLPIFTWNYKGDKVKHIGPMAQDMKKHFGVGDGKTIHLVDVMGILLAAEKERNKKERRA